MQFNLSHEEKKPCFNQKLRYFIIIIVKKLNKKTGFFMNGS